MYKLNSFDLQKFGGKESSNSTTYQSRPLTADETRAMKTYADYGEAASKTAYPLMNRSTTMLNNGSTIDPNYNNLYSQQAAGTAANSQTANNLASGILSQNFIDNRNAQAKTYADSAIGGLLNSLNSRGVINSSVTNSGLNDINKTMAEAFTNSYTNDLNTSQGLLNNAQSYVDMPIAQANQAQQASYQMPLALYGAATGQMSPTANIYSQATASQNQNGTQTTTQSGGGGGLFGSVLGGFLGRM